jgi:hypothetical protein
LITLTTGIFVGPLQQSDLPTLHLTPTLVTDLFSVFYLVVMGMSWYNFARSYYRARTPTSKRRMIYLIFGALAPAFGSFPFLLFGSNFAARHTILFWFTAALINLMVVGMIIIMAYSVAFFGVSWPDRVVKRRLFKWIMRGPVTAIITLSATTITRRLGVTLGTDPSTVIPIVMAISILLSEYLITIFGPAWEDLLFYRNEQNEISVVQRFETRLITRGDLEQFIELILAAVCDRLQSSGAYLASLSNGGMEVIIMIGRVKDEGIIQSDEIKKIGEVDPTSPELLEWGKDLIVPLWYEEDGVRIRLLGVLGITQMAGIALENEQAQALNLLAGRATSALIDRQQQQKLFQSMQDLTDDVDTIQQVRAAGRYNDPDLLMNRPMDSQQDLSQWVKEALNHYWGGPKLTESPLLKLKIVEESLEDYEGNQANAVRAILRQAIDRIRPEGERRYTGDWILYNILRMKFLEGKKVRDVAVQLAMSEADLYRKQRIAIEEVARSIHEMDQKLRENSEIDG